MLQDLRPARLRARCVINTAAAPGRTLTSCVDRPTFQLHRVVHTPSLASSPEQRRFTARLSLRGIVIALVCALHAIH